MAASVELLRNLRIPIEGGLSLAADLYRASGAAAGPAIVVALPYLKDGIAGSSTVWFLEQSARQGFNVLLVDLRGCGASEGLAREPFAADDADDGVAAVEWAARQDWCNGRVGFWGASYGGIMALRTAARRPHALRAIVAVECAADLGNDFFHPDGIRGGMSPAGQWPTGDLLMQLLPPLHRDADGDGLRLWKQRLPEVRPRLFDYLRRAPNDRYWNDNAIAIEAIETPTLIAAGWRDFFCGPSLSVHRRLRATKKLVVGPWTHLMPDQSPVEPIDFMSITIRWWRRWLMDEANGIEHEPEVSAYIQNRKCWHGFDTWPPAASTRQWFARDGGALEAESGAFSPVEKPVDPIMGFRDQLWGFPLSGLPHDSVEDDRAALCFTTPPLAASIVIAGAPRVRASIGRNSVGVGWVSARLSVVDADGASRLVCSGAASCPIPGTVDIVLNDTGIEIAAGQRLRLGIAAADFPRLWPQAGASTLQLDAAPHLSVPVIELSDDSRWSPPRHDPTPPFAALALSFEPEWSVQHDLLSSTTTLTVGQSASMFTPGREGILELSSRVSASVSRPSGTSRVIGIGRACARWPDQPAIVVEGRLQVGDTAAEAFATIREGEALIFERSWKLESLP